MVCRCLWICLDRSVTLVDKFWICLVDCVDAQPSKQVANRAPGTWGLRPKMVKTFYSA